MTSRVLILPASATPTGAVSEITQGRRPRIDYLDLQVRLNADIIDFGVYERAPQRWMARLDRAARLAWGQALYIVQHWQDYDLIYSLGEDIALPLAFLLRLRGWRPRHLVVAHNIASHRKAFLVRGLRVMNTFERIIVLSQAELHQVARAYHLVAERICFLVDAIDEVFWQPVAGGGVRQVSANRFLLSVGQAKRDYATLFRAVENLPCRLDIRAGSQWLDESTRRFQALPINVEMRPRVSFTHLRELYENANFVVIALLPEAHHSAGSVSIKEAMAMGKAVVVASSGGQADYVRHGRTGLLTPAGDSAALAQAIRLLLENPNMAAWMGRNARALLERDMRYDAKLDRLVQLAQVNSQVDSILTSTTHEAPM